MNDHAAVYVKEGIFYFSRIGNILIMVGILEIIIAPMVYAYIYRRKAAAQMLQQHNQVGLLDSFNNWLFKYQKHAIWPVILRYPLIFMDR